MTYLLTFKVAFSALMRTKTRSLLTILGVIIGVGAVIAMVSIGESAKAKVAKSFESMGTNTLMIRPGSSSRGGVRGGAGSRDTITWEDLKAIRDIDLIVNAAPELTTNAQVLTESSNWSTKITGTESEWFTIRNLKAESGEMFTEIDVSQATKVAVIGKTVSDALFGEGVDPVGEQIRIGHVPFNVIGLAKSRAARGSTFEATFSRKPGMLPALPVPRPRSNNSYSSATRLPTVPRQTSRFTTLQRSLQPKRKVPIPSPHC